MRLVSIHEPAHFRENAHRARLGCHIMRHSGVKLLLRFAHDGGDKGHASVAIDAGEKRELKWTFLKR